MSDAYGYYITFENEQVYKVRTEEFKEFYSRKTAKSTL